MRFPICAGPPIREVLSQAARPRKLHAVHLRVRPIRGTLRPDDGMCVRLQRRPERRGLPTVSTPWSRTSCRSSSTSCGLTGPATRHRRPARPRGPSLPGLAPRPNEPRLLLGLLAMVRLTGGAAPWRRTTERRAPTVWIETATRGVRSEGTATTRPRASSRSVRGVQRQGQRLQRRGRRRALRSTPGRVSRSGRGIDPVANHRRSPRIRPTVRREPPAFTIRSASRLIRRAMFSRPIVGTTRFGRSTRRAPSRRSRARERRAMKTARRPLRRSTLSGSTERPVLRVTVPTISTSPSSPPTGSARFRRTERSRHSRDPELPARATERGRRRLSTSLSEWRWTGPETSSSLIGRII